MKIEASEVESIKTIGSLFGDEVKIVRLVGGYQIALGKKEKNSKKAEALAAGSHAGIVAHQIEKQFKEDFQPAIFKSEQDRLETVSECTKYLPMNHQDFGLELFALNKGENYDVVLYKHGVTLGEYNTVVEGDKLLIKSVEFKTQQSNQDIARAFAAVFEDIMNKHGLKKVEKSTL